MVVAHHCEHTENHWTVCFKRVNFILWELLFHKQFWNSLGPNSSFWFRSRNRHFKQVFPPQRFSWTLRNNNRLKSRSCGFRRLLWVRDQGTFYKAENRNPWLSSLVSERANSHLQGHPEKERTEIYKPALEQVGRNKLQHLPKWNRWPFGPWVSGENRALIQRLYIQVFVHWELT